jgi:hypothetical protein
MIDFSNRADEVGLMMHFLSISFVRARSHDDVTHGSHRQGIGNTVVALIFSIAKREVTFLSGTAAIKRL